MRIIRRIWPLVAALLLVAVTAVAAGQNEVKILQASASPKKAATVSSLILGENLVPTSSVQLTAQNESSASIQQEAYDPPLAKIDSDASPASTQIVGMERFEHLQLPTASKRGDSAIKASAPRRGARSEKAFSDKQVKLAPSAERQLLRINLALDNAKQTLQASQTDVLINSNDNKKTLAAPSKIALKSVDPAGVRVKRHKDGYVKRVSGQFKLEPSNQTVAERVAAFLRANHEDLNLDPTFTYALEESCNSSRCLVKAVKYFDGKEVFGDDLSLITVQDQIKTISGRMARWSSPAQAKTSASKEDLEKIAKAHLGLVGQTLLADLDPVEGYRYQAGRYYSVIKLSVVTSMSDAWTVFIRTDNNEVIDKLPLSYDQSSVSSSGIDLLGETQFFFHNR